MAEEMKCSSLTQLEDQREQQRPGTRGSDAQREPRGRRAACTVRSAPALMVRGLTGLLHGSSGLRSPPLTEARLLPAPPFLSSQPGVAMGDSGLGI